MTPATIETLSNQLDANEAVLHVKLAKIREGHTLVNEFHAGRADAQTADPTGHEYDIATALQSKVDQSD